MKKILLLAFSLTSLAWLVVACTNSGTTGTGTANSGSATATPVVTVAATIGASGIAFSPSNVTITHGQAVVFNSTLSGSHNVYLNGFSGSATPVSGCALTAYTSFPVTVTFPTAGTYGFHCAIHDTCGTTNCSTCSGMNGAVTVN